MGRYLKVVVCFIFGCLCGCSTAYRPAKSGEGYSDSKIAPDEFAVGFQGNSKTDLGTATDFALLRAAQVTLENGYSCFAVQDTTNTSSLRTYVAKHQYYAPASAASSPLVTTPTAPLLHPSGYTVQYQETATDFQPGTVLRIKCFKTKPDKPFTYDAATLQQSLKQKYKLSYRTSNRSTVAASSTRYSSPFG